MLTVKYQNKEVKYRWEPWGEDSGLVFLYLEIPIYDKVAHVTIPMPLEEACEHVADITPFIERGINNAIDRLNMRKEK